MNGTEEEARLYVQCGKPHVKAVKTWLEGQNALHKKEKIKSVLTDEDTVSDFNSLGMLLLLFDQCHHSGRVNAATLTSPETLPETCD